MASTETEGANAQAIRTNKLALVERLADDLAHEIKNPLHSMVINLEVLRRRIARLQEAEQGDLMRYAGVLGGELDRVTRRIEILLRLVRPERGADLTTLPQTIEEMLDILELERERHGVAIDFRPAPQPLRGHLPREHARQITLNLLLEALDSTAPGGSVTVLTEVRDARALLRIEAAPLAASSEIAAGVEPARVAVARALVENLSGELELNGAPAGVPDPGRTLGLTVSLPTDGA